MATPYMRLRAMLAYLHQRLRASGATSTWIVPCWFQRSNKTTGHFSSDSMVFEHHQIGAAAARLADRLPHSVLITLAEAVAKNGGRDWRHARQAILQILPTPDFRDATSQFLDVWYLCAK